MHVKKSEYEQRNPKPDRPKGRNGQYLTMEKPSHARNAGALNPGRHRYRHSTCSIMSTKRSATATSITSSAAWEKSLGRLRGMVVVICHTYEGVSRPSGLAVPRGQPPPATHAIFVARIRNDGVMKSYFIHRAAGAGFSGHFGNMRRWIRPVSPISVWLIQSDRYRPVARDDAAQLGINGADFIKVRFKLQPNQLQIFGLQRVPM
jgi:hypothetical protein